MVNFPLLFPFQILCLDLFELQLFLETALVVLLLAQSLLGVFFLVIEDFLIPVDVKEGPEVGLRNFFNWLEVGVGASDAVEVQFVLVHRLIPLVSLLDFSV